MFDGERARVGNPGREFLQQCIHERRLVTESREQREVDIHRGPWLAPAQERYSPDEAKAPLIPRADDLKRLRRFQDLKNGGASS